MSHFDKNFSLGVNTDHLESTRCVFDFLHFLKHVKTITVDGEEKHLPLDWPYIRKLAQLIEQEKRLVVLKARQIMVSWLIVAYSLHACLKNDNLTILIISQGRDDAEEMIRRAYDIYDRLPAFLQKMIPLKEGPRNKQSIEFANKSRIRSLPSKAAASRGKSPQIVFIDEGAYCRELDGMLTAIEPQLGPNSQLFIVSTPNPFPMGRPFTQLCKEAHNKGYRRFDIPYTMCPVYQDPEWERQKRASMSPQKFSYEFECCLAGAGEGMVFPGFGERHEWEGPFLPTEKFTLFRCIDPGPKMAIIWLAEDSIGNLIAYREAYFHGGSYANRAMRILNLSGEEQYEWSVIDSADPQAKTDLGKNGVFCRSCLKKDVYETIDMINLLLEGDGLDMPTLYITENCPKLKEQIQEWVGDDCGYPVKHQYDHGVDALRYGVHLRMRWRHLRQHGGVTVPQYDATHVDRDLELDLGPGTLIVGDNDHMDREFNEDHFDLGY
jgi:hypothetical protein